MKKYSASAEEGFVPESEDPMVGVEKVEEEDSRQGFPEEYIEPLRGLLFLGKLVKNFVYAGHDFLIRTLTEGEMIKVGQFLDSYKGSYSESEARKALTVAACVESVDGYPIVSNLGPRDDYRNKVDVVMKWYPPVIDYVYSRYRELEIAEFEISGALKK